MKTLLAAIAAIAGGFSTLRVSVLLESYLLLAGAMALLVAGVAFGVFAPGEGMDTRRSRV